MNDHPMKWRTVKTLIGKRFAAMNDGAYLDFDAGGVHIELHNKWNHSAIYVEWDTYPAEYWQGLILPEGAGK